jgi:CRP-like cAMP-binding protein
MKYFQELQQTKVFSMANEFECQAMMFCFKTRFKNFEKNQPIVTQGEQMEDVVLIVKGGANIENIDSLGNITIISELKRGDVYGVESAYAGEEVYKDSLIATEKSLVLFMNKHRLITPCENKCRRHEFVTKNLMSIVAETNISLLDKMMHMSKKTIRDKLLSYFSSMSVKSNSEYFEIPFNKTQLANYLSVDRSALTTELSKMRDDGLIDYEKKQYRLIKGRDK